MVKRKAIIAKGGAVAIGAGLYHTRKRNEMELIMLASDIDASRFNGWFRSNNVSYKSIAAMWLTESAGNPRATNLTGGDGRQGGAWGLGQVTALTATDYGILMPLAPLMLLPAIGARVSMEHVQFTVRGLRRQGLAGDAPQWVQAYNVGLTGFINGRRNQAHLTRFLTHLA